MIRITVLTFLALRASAFSFVPCPPTPTFSLPSSSSSSRRATSSSSWGRQRQSVGRPSNDDSRGRVVVRSSIQGVAALASVVEENEANEQQQGGRTPPPPARPRNVDEEPTRGDDSSSVVTPRRGRSASTPRRVKGPRFVQAAHVERHQKSPPLSPRPNSGSSKKMPVSFSDDEGPASGRVRGGGIRPTGASSSPPPPRPPASSVPSSSNIDKDQMWRRSKTIEELESALMARWGTDARQWTDYDDAEDDDVEGDNLSRSADGDHHATSSSQPAVRARPVYDPWDNDDDDNDDDTSPPKDRESSSSSSSSAFRVSDLIRDKPVGGRGSRSLPATAPKASAVVSANPGFFFRPPPVPAVEATPEPPPRATTESRTLKRTSPRSSDPAGPRDERPVAAAKGATAGNVDADMDQSPARSGPPPASRPLFDERDGVTPLFLTTGQAVRNYEDARRTLPRDDEEDATDRAESSDSVSGSLPAAAPPSWTDLGVTSPKLLDNLRRMDCDSPLPVQRQMLEYLLSPPRHDGVSDADPRSDVICGTMTGSGKTLSFLVPLAQRLMDHLESSQESGPSPPCALVVAPGRELASQIVSVARDLLQDTGMVVQLAIGGTTYARNLEVIRKRKPHIIVGTPGRLAELVAGRPGEAKGRLAKIFRPSTLVLDEFDALLEYKPHREKTLALLQVLKRDPHVQTIVCSATASDMMKQSGARESMSPRQLKQSLIDDYLRPGYRVAMAESPDILTASGANDDLIGTRVSRTVIHGVVHVPHRRYALETLRRVLYTDPTPQQVLVFVKDSRKVKIVVERLERDGIIAAPLSGDDDKMDRADVSRALREGYVGLVVATELAARGLDAPLLTHVINLDLPTDASHYAHRAGRCGRGNRPGVVINVTTMPQERSVPRKLADKLGVDMFTVEVRNGKLNIVDPSSQTLDVR